MLTTPTSLTSTPPHCVLLLPLPSVTEACERYAYYGLRSVLTLYLNRVLLFSATSATSLSLYSQALAYFMPMLGGYVADTHLGKYTTIMSAQRAQPPLTLSLDPSSYLTASLLPHLPLSSDVAAGTSPLCT